MNNWTEYELFVQVVELGSLGKAAVALGLSTPSASRHLATLEQRLGARLIDRTTRKIFVTEVGQSFYARCKAILDEMREAAAAVTATTTHPSGTLRVTASQSLGLKHVAPLLPEFHRRHPAVRVELIAANQYHDTLGNNIDVAIRAREYEPDSTHVVRKIADVLRILVASPSYLECHGIPEAPRELSGHQLLVYSHHNPEEMTFQRRDEIVTVRTNPTLNANDAQILRAAAIQGLGILALPVYVMYDDLVCRRLVPLMLDWELPRLSISVVYPRRSLVPAKTRAFIDFLLEDFRRHDYERRWASVVAPSTTGRS